MLNIYMLNIAQFNNVDYFCRKFKTRIIMRRIITLVVATFATVLSVSAHKYETPENEIAVGVGLGTHAYIGVAFGNALADAIKGEGGSENSIGAYSLTYLHNLNKHIAVGATGLYEYMYSESDDGEKSSESFITVMPTARAYWFRTKSFGMYSRVAAGVSFSMFEDYKDGSTTELENKNKALFAFHVAPVSFEVGSNKFSGFLELGYGYQGFVNAGLKFGF